MQYTTEYYYDDPETIFNLAQSILKDKLKAFKENLLKVDTGATEEPIIKIQQTVFVDSECLELSFKNETHTLCNVIQQYLVRNPKIKYAGYYQPHILKPLYVMRVIPVVDHMVIENVLLIVSETIDRLLSL